MIWEKHYRNGKLPSHIKKGSFWWRDNLKLLSKFKNFTVISIENGQSCLFWTDNWRSTSPATLAPELLSYAKNKLLSVSMVANTEVFSELFHLPVSNEALVQMQSLGNDVSLLVLTATNDKWSYRWGSSNFSSSKIYKELMEHLLCTQYLNGFGRTPVNPNTKCSCGCYSKTGLRRKHMAIQSYNCVLCNCATEETFEHLFLNCNFA